AIRIVPVTSEPTKEILDDGDPGFGTVGTWGVATFQGFQDDVHYSAAGVGDDVATWTFEGIGAGTYEVFATWTAHTNRASNAPYSIEGGAPVLINQEIAPNDEMDQGVGWELLDQVTITGSSLEVELSDNANEFVIADAIRIVPVTGLNGMQGNSGAIIKSAPDGFDTLLSSSASNQSEDPIAKAASELSDLGFTDSPDANVLGAAASSVASADVFSDTSDNANNVLAASMNGEFFEPNAVVM
ncbi:MAG TPA: hypothetical protein DCF68_20405, partial [Cyanothece sp. UBA12306]|nr:hypothetical protein [Cyanothece sp. UBA12306]